MRSPYFMIALGLSLMVFARPLLQHYYSIPYSHELACIIWGAVLCAGIFLIYRHGGKNTERQIILWAIFFTSLYPIVSSIGHLNRQLSISATAGSLSPDKQFLTWILAVAGLALVTYGLAGCDRLHRALCATSKALLYMQTVRPSRILTGLCCLFVAGAVATSWLFYQFIPAIPDTITQYIHAKVFAEGKLFGQAPLMTMKSFFPVYLVTHPDGKWYSSYQPLHIFFLSLGHRINAPWLIAPLMGAAAIVLSYLLGKKTYGEHVGRLAALLTCFSPLIFFMSAEYMNHTTAHALCLAFVYAYFMMLDENNNSNRLRSCIFGTIAGACVGGVILTRPLTAVALVFPFIIYSLLLIARYRKQYLLPLACVIGATLFCVLLQLCYNHILTGNIWLFPYVEANPRNTPWFNHGHTLELALSKALMEWHQMNRMLLEWSIPSTAFVLICMFRYHDSRTMLLFATIVSFTLFNLTNRFASFTWGPRYIYESSGFILILAAAGICALPTLLSKQRIIQAPLMVISGALTLAIMCAFLTGWFYRIPENVRLYSTRYQFNNYHYHNLVTYGAPEYPAVIFVNPRIRAYYAVATNLPNHLGDRLIVAADRGQENCELLKHLPGYHSYIERRWKILPYTDCQEAIQ